MPENIEVPGLEIPGIGTLKVDSIFSTAEYDALCVISFDGDRIIAYDIDEDDDNDSEEDLEFDKSEVISILPEVQDREYDKLR